MVYPGNIAESTGSSGKNHNSALKRRVVLNNQSEQMTKQSELVLLLKK